MIDEIVTFFSSPVFTIVGGITTLIAILVFAYTVFLFFKGVLPVWYRIGIGLSKRKVAIFADKNYSDLDDLIKDSKIFNKTIKIHKGNIKKAKTETIFLVHWGEYKNEIDKIINIKETSTPLIIYSPQGTDKINQDSLEKINNEPNSVIVNFKGRLLNDIFTSVITTSYDKK
jgi:hypothetical protein